MRWRLENELGYQWTHRLEIKNLKGNPISQMILATDNAAGTKIMSDLYTDAARHIPKMRKDALVQQRAVRQERLLDMDVEVEPYHYDAPTNPEGDN